MDDLGDGFWNWMDNGSGKMVEDGVFGGIGGFWRFSGAIVEIRLKLNVKFWGDGRGSNF
jgi:hypothetical protein